MLSDLKGIQILTILKYQIPNYFNYFLKKCNVSLASITNEFKLTVMNSVCWPSHLLYQHHVSCFAVRRAWKVYANFRQKCTPCAVTYSVPMAIPNSEVGKELMWVSTWKSIWHKRTAVGDPSEESQPVLTGPVLCSCVVDLFSLITADLFSYSSELLPDS